MQYGDATRCATMPCDAVWSGAQTVNTELAIQLNVKSRPNDSMCHNPLKLLKSFTNLGLPAQIGPRAHRSFVSCGRPVPTGMKSSSPCQGRGLRGTVERISMRHTGTTSYVYRRYYCILYYIRPAGNRTSKPHVTAGTADEGCRPLLFDTKSNPGRRG